MTAERGARSRFAVIGFGRIGARLIERLPGAANAPQLVGVLAGPRQREEAQARLGAGRVFAQLEDLLAQAPDIVVECASAQALIENGPAILASGADLMPLSLSAFADRDVEARLLDAAERGPGRLEIPAGAMASIDMLAAAREDGLSAVTFRAAYPPLRWRGTPAEALLDLDGVSAPTRFLTASVRAAVGLFPRHINVAVGVALAGLGLDRTSAELTADLALKQARFELIVDAAPGAIHLVVSGRDAGLGEDPVDYTTFSLMRLLRRRQARILI